ncbi:hypothetical protein JW905_05245, partial [bacterium]|nr:hypothetical protein [candidate division CSSED10-310 bacterium]
AEGAIYPVQQTIGDFTVPAGSDRLLVAFVTYEQGSSPQCTDVTYNALPLTREVHAAEGTLFSDLWYLPLGSGPDITADLTATFTGSPNTVLAAASFHNVNQLTPIGGSDTQNGGGSGSTSLDMATSSALNLLVSNMANYADWMFMEPVDAVPTGNGQVEIFDLANEHGQAGEGCIQPATGGTVTMSWTFQSMMGESMGWALAAMELNHGEEPITPTPEPSPTITEPPTASPTASPTLTPTASSTPVPSDTPTVTMTPTITRTPTAAPIPSLGSTGFGLLLLAMGMLLGITRRRRK